MDVRLKPLNNSIYPGVHCCHFFIHLSQYVFIVRDVLWWCNRSSRDRVGEVFIPRFQVGHLVAQRLYTFL
jgi:hypothetical protein